MTMHRYFVVYWRPDGAGNAEMGTTAEHITWEIIKDWQRQIDENLSHERVPAGHVRITNYIYMHDSEH